MLRVPGFYTISGFKLPRAQEEYPDWLLSEIIASFQMRMAEVSESEDSDEGPACDAGLGPGPSGSGMLPLEIVEAGSSDEEAPEEPVPSTHACRADQRKEQLKQHGKCPVAVPDKFTSKQAMFPAVLGQCQLFISLRAEDFPTDWDKVGFVISLLSGSAARWATPLLHPAHTFSHWVAAMNHDSGFCDHLHLMYEDPIKTQAAARHLKDLQQGQESQDSAWNEAALMDTLQDGLSDKLQDELAWVDCPMTLNMLIHLCLRIDACLQRDSCGPCGVETPAPQEEAMDLGATRPCLSVTEHNRRRAKGLCLYCRELGYLAASCPKKQREALALVSSVSVPDSQTQTTLSGNGRTDMDSGPPRHLILVVQGFLANSSQGIPVHALVDSGTTTNFMDMAFATQYEVPQCPVVPPLLVETIDGRVLLSGPIRAATQPFHLTISSHEEAIQFYITSRLHFPMVLGVAWLQSHDPQIYWSQNLITFLSLQCTDHTHQVCARQVMTLPEVSVPSEHTDFADIFSEQEVGQLLPHQPYDCSIDLVPDAALPVGHLYSMSDMELATLWDFLDKNLARSFIRPSSSPLSAPVLFVKKKMGDLHLCCDYRQFNAITQLREATVFMKLDLHGAYNLVWIWPRDEWKTAFGTRYGHFEYTVMPFGLTNAPTVFQHFINDIFWDLLDQFVVVYLNDILIYSNLRDSHLHHLHLVLQWLWENCLYAKLEKCQFFQSTIKCLGHCISLEGISMELSKDVQQFLRFANYYSTFIPGFTSLTAPLTWFLQKKVPFWWGAPEQQVFQALKQAFMNEPILKHAVPHHPFVVEADASNVAVGAMLLKAHASGGILFPCAYYSRKLNPAKHNWEKELLVIKAGFEAWKHHLEGACHQVEVQTVHKNLEFLKTAQKLNQHQIWWYVFFAHFNFHVTYIPSGRNQWADALSWKPENLCPEDQPPLWTVLPVESFSIMQEPVDLRAQIRETQRHNTWADQQKTRGGIQLAMIVHGGTLALFRALRPLQDIASHVSDFLVALTTTRCVVLCYVLCAMLAGQVGGCSSPCRHQRDLGICPPSSGFTTVFVVIDMLTKMAHFIPCCGLPMARATTGMFIQHIFWIHGLPNRMVSDRGMQFTAQFWKGLMMALDIKICLLSSHHLETEGRMEKVIGILEQYLRFFFAFNNSQHTSMQITPFLTNVGYHPWFFPLTPLDSLVLEVKNFLSELQAVHQLVQHYLQKAKDDFNNTTIGCGGSGVVVYLAPSVRSAGEEARPSIPWYIPCRGSNQLSHLLPDFALLAMGPSSFHRSLLVPEQLVCLLLQPAPALPTRGDSNTLSNGRAMDQKHSLGRMRCLSMSWLWWKSFTQNSRCSCIWTVRHGERALCRCGWLRSWRARTQMREPACDAGMGPGPSGSGMLPLELWRLAAVMKRPLRSPCPVRMRAGLLKGKSSCSSMGDSGPAEKLKFFAEGKEV
ncbi:Retrotransposon-derived protein PEG10, partial [Ophiophagus hannah]